LTTSDEFVNWAKPIICKFAEICLPEHSIEFVKRINPQDEEIKEEPTLKEKLYNVIDDFTF